MKMWIRFIWYRQTSSSGLVNKIMYFWIPKFLKWVSISFWNKSLCNMESVTWLCSSWQYGFSYMVVFFMTIWSQLHGCVLHDNLESVTWLCSSWQSGVSYMVVFFMTIWSQLHGCVLHDNMESVTWLCSSWQSGVSYMVVFFMTITVLRNEAEFTLQQVMKAQRW